MDDTFLTFDDVLIAPAYSDIDSRQDIDTGADFLGTPLDIPIVSANMDFVTGPQMAITMNAYGALGILHRFWETPSDYLAAIRLVAEYTIPVWFSIGIRDTKTSLEFVKTVVGETQFIRGICIDVAHGHHKKVGDMIELIKGSPDDQISGLRVVAGNVATYEGSIFLYEHGVDAIKVGIGAGSVCTTRTVAGVGIPQWSAILECAQVKQEYPNAVIIADGGSRSSGDVAKALAVGADAVMLGNLLAGTDEAPGEIINRDAWENPLQEPKKFKRYRGQASFGSNGDHYVKEGIEGIVPYKGPVAPIIQQIQAGLRSSMSYVGARNLTEFRQKAKFVQVSSHTLMENNTRVIEHE